MAEEEAEILNPPADEEVDNNNAEEGDTKDVVDGTDGEIIGGVTNCGMFSMFLLMLWYENGLGGVAYCRYALMVMLLLQTSVVCRW